MCAHCLFLASSPLRDSCGFRHLDEGTYYGPQSDILPVGTRVFAAQEFASAGSGPIARNTFGIVQAESAWDEDSSDPDRLITVTLSSGEVVSLPCHILHR